MSTNRLNVLELFAGVGGFRIGLENADKDFFHTKWSNQWEPSRKAQDAFDCYNSHFPDSVNLNQDIATLDFREMEDCNMIVGGFPCQDYSVARSLSGGMGIQGKKGVLFWEIINAVKSIRPDYLLLENVDRLLKSPAKQRGRDFAIMLSTFDDLGYYVEWRVINAADYGMAQRRRRVFIFIAHKSTQIAKTIETYNGENIVFQEGIFAKAFPILQTPYKERISSQMLPKDIFEISDSFTGTIYNTGIMMNGNITTIDTKPVEETPVTLGEILEKEVPEKYYLTEAATEKFKYLRGPKKIERTSAEGHSYIFSEGGMSETDDLDKPGRTMLTSEGTTNRSTHIVKDWENRLRFLTPIECERLNDFPDNWTNTMSDRMRYFCMGNALVTGIVKRVGEQIKIAIQANSPSQISKQGEELVAKSEQISLNLEREQRVI